MSRSRMLVPLLLFACVVLLILLAFVAFPPEYEKPAAEKNNSVVGNAANGTRMSSDPLPDECYSDYFNSFICTQYTQAQCENATMNCSWCATFGICAWTPPFACNFSSVGWGFDAFGPSCETSGVATSYMYACTSRNYEDFSGMLTNSCADPAATPRCVLCNISNPIYGAQEMCVPSPLQGNLTVNADGYALFAPVTFIPDACPNQPEYFGVCNYNEVYNLEYCKYFNASECADPSVGGMLKCGLCHGFCAYKPSPPCWKLDGSANGLVNTTYGTCEVASYFWELQSVCLDALSQAECESMPCAWCPIDPFFATDYRLVYACMPAPNVDNFTYNSCSFKSHSCPVCSHTTCSLPDTDGFSFSTGGIDDTSTASDGGSGLSAGDSGNNSLTGSGIHQSDGGNNSAYSTCAPARMICAVVAAATGWLLMIA